MSSIDKLIELLSGEDDERASLAMRELLTMQNVGEVIAEHEDTDNPRLRKRIHQLASIFNRIVLGATLNHVIRDHTRSAWDVFCQINVILDQQTSLVQINDLLMSIVCYDRFRCKNAEQFVDFIRETGLSVEHTPDRYLTEYLPSDVLFTRTGADLVIAALAQQAAKLHSYRLTLGCLDGVPCLRDSSFCVISPAANWEISHPPMGKFEPATTRSMAIRLLSDIFVASILEQLHTVTFTSSNLLTLISGLDQKAADDLTRKP